MALFTRKRLGVRASRPQRVYQSKMPSLPEKCEHSRRSYSPFIHAPARIVPVYAAQRKAPDGEIVEMFFIE